MKNYFTPSEFIKKGFPNPAGPVELFLLKNLRDKILNPIRREIGRPMRITDCYRIIAKYKRMLEARNKDGSRKYNPSATSDHFWGQPVPTIKKRDRQKYGKIYSFSVGAVDFYIPRVKMADVFDFVVGMEKEFKIRTGQIVLEHNPATKFSWIHISNPKEILLSDTVINDLGLSKFKYLISENNGKSYESI